MHVVRRGRCNVCRATAPLWLVALLLAGCGAAGAPQAPEGYQARPDRDFVLDPLVKSGREQGPTAPADAAGAAK